MRVIHKMIPMLVRHRQKGFVLFYSPSMDAHTLDRIRIGYEKKREIERRKNAELELKRCVKIYSGILKTRVNYNEGFLRHYSILCYSACPCITFRSTNFTLPVKNV